MSAAAAAAAKEPPETFALRARPRPVTRINRRVLAVLGGIAASGILVVVTLALETPTRTKDAEFGDVVIPIRPRTEVLETLPKHYSEWVEPEPVPAPSAPPAELPDAGNPEAEAARVQAAKLEEEARASEIQFRLSGAPGRATETDAGPAAAPGDPPDGDHGESGRAGDAAAAPHRHPHRIEDPVSPWQVMAGTILRASLITGLHSDLPGFVTAQITEDVYDTASGSVLLIPRGTRLLGQYGSDIDFGQERAYVAWQRLILPDGSSILVDDLPATDRSGYAGLHDRVDFHTGRVFRGAVLSTLLGVGSELAVDDDHPLERAFRSSAQDTMDLTVGEMARRNLDVQPTLTVRPGWPLAVIVHRDLVLRPWDPGRAFPARSG